MKMISAGAGLGMGVKDYRVVFVFETDKALDRFLNSGCRVQRRRTRRRKQASPAPPTRARSRLPRVLGVPNYQEWSRPPVNAAGHQVLQR